MVRHFALLTVLTFLTLSSRVSAVATDCAAGDTFINNGGGQTASLICKVYSDILTNVTLTPTAVDVNKTSETPQKGPDGKVIGYVVGCSASCQWSPTNIRYGVTGTGLVCKTTFAAGLFTGQNPIPTYPAFASTDCGPLVNDPIQITFSTYASTDPNSACTLEKATSSCQQKLKPLPMGKSLPYKCCYTPPAPRTSP